MRIIFFLVLMCGITQAALADVYVIYNTSTKEVMSVQDDDSAVLETGFTKKIIEGKTIANFQFDSSVTDYKIVNDKFVLNVKKLSDRENAKADGEAKEIKRKSDRESAETKLKALGLTQAEVDAL